jgi:hypothetical protein
MCSVLVVERPPDKPISPLPLQCFPSTWTATNERYQLRSTQSGIGVGPPSGSGRLGSSDGIPSGKSFYTCVFHRRLRPYVQLAPQYYPLPACLIDHADSVRRDGSHVNISTDQDASPAAIATNLDSPLHITWGNARWNDLVGRAGLEECVDLTSLKRFHEWLEADQVEDGNVTLSLELKQGATLTLIRTCVPAIPPRKRSFTIVTTTHLSYPNTDRDTPEQLSNGSAGHEPPQSVSTGRRVSLDDIPELEITSNSTKDRGCDGVDEGKPPGTIITDCQLLLEQVDWSKTSLGPRHTWPPSIELMIKTVMASKTQDALWVGEECVMI